MVGLDYEGLEVVRKAHGIRDEEYMRPLGNLMPAWPEVFEQIQVMELAAIPLLNKT